MIIMMMMIIYMYIYIYICIQTTKSFYPGGAGPLMSVLAVLGNKSYGVSSSSYHTLCLDVASHISFHWDRCCMGHSSTLKSCWQVAKHVITIAPVTYVGTSVVLPWLQYLSQQVPCQHVIDLNMVCMCLSATFVQQTKR